MGNADVDGLLIAAAMLLFPLLYLASIVWAAIDAIRRDRSGCLIGLLVFFTWPLGLLLWLIARPPKGT